MAQAWSEDWLVQQTASCKQDTALQEGAEGFDRYVVMHVLADPDRGVPQDRFVGFDPPYMSEVWTATENRKPDADYIIEGSYADWWAVNEGKKGLVASLLDQSIRLRAGSTSYIAMFVPDVDRWYQLSRSVTDSYEGDFKVER